MTDNTFYWHDYETFGTDPQKDKPAQFAGIRTDEDLNIIDDPLVLYLKPASDTLPHPDACLITGITPQLAGKKGLCEADFIGLIHSQMAQPNTCTIGYNNIRFDDEVTRNCLYRNFYDPYAREWQNGNSRWDLIDVVRAAKALRPDGIVWPINNEGRPSIKLDQLTLANGIAHESAHDALSDVYATLALARLIRRVQPKLYHFLYTHRLKSEALKLLNLGSWQPAVHVSGRYAALKNYLGVVLPLVRHPTNSNGIIVYDLSVDPEPLLELTCDQIRQILFTAAEHLPEGAVRIPLKTIHVNKSPVLAPISVIRPADAERLELDLAFCLSNISKLSACPALADKIAKVFEEPSGADKNCDPDFAIYSGGFFSDADKQTMRRVREMAPEQLAAGSLPFRDGRLPEMLFRYRARNYPETLTPVETQRWQKFCRNRLTGREACGSLTFDDYFRRLQELKREDNINNDIIAELERYGTEIMNELGLNQDCSQLN
ncbi:MAG: exodeoxyribonuclease I [Gammaproteobacteria bacterium]